LEKREKKREGELALMQELAPERASRYFVEVICGPCIYKVVHFCSLLFYIIAKADYR
jgi:hypothetical protein